MSAPPTHKSPSTFEFTKRKRWADLLIYELSDAITLVLSGDASVWFCNRAVSELLGWSDTDLIDRPFTDLVNDDRRAFRAAFDQSLHARTELNAYVRLKARSPITPQNIPQSEVLFEVNGHPCFVENEPAPRCFFAVAKPYPSRNVAMLNTFLELKVENERLQKRLAELRVRAPSPSAPAPGPSTLRSSPVPQASPPSDPLCSSDAPGALYLAHLSYDNFGSPGSQAQGSAYDVHGLHTYSGQYASAASTQPADDDLGDDTSRRKRMRKSHHAEQHVCVTCGRTDSPEWRKGPQGPKTLCNACGLRWAKEVRNKVDEPNAAAGASSTANNA